MGNILLIIFSSISFFLCFLIIVSIFLQEDKSGGGIGIIGGSSQSFFGASSGSLLARITTVLTTIFLILSIILALISSTFSKDAIISKEDIFQSETYDYQATKKRKLTYVPERVLVYSFEKDLLEKISDENNKKAILDVYKKDKEGQYYVLSKKLKKTEEKKILEIMNSVGFTLQTEDIEIKSSDTTED